MDLNILGKALEHSVPAIKKAGEVVSAPKVEHVIPKTVPDVFVKGSDTAAKDIKPFDFTPPEGSVLSLNPAQRRKIGETVTSNPEEQALLFKMLDNETIVVTDAVEQKVMKTQMNNFIKSHPEVSREQIYVYSPKPKDKIKSYTQSGQTFAKANGIDSSHIKTNFDEIPEGSTVFMSDDCSISGASMVFDLLERLPENFKGRIVFSPTVIGSGKTSKGIPMADEVLRLFGKINDPKVDRKSIEEKLDILISDNKTDNKKALAKLLNPDSYSGVSIETASGSLEAKNFRQTPTFLNLPKREQRHVDSLFTADGINTGYHNSGVMVAFQTKSPNNNVGIMELVGKEMGIQVKPSGILSFTDNMKLKHNNKRCAITLLPKANSNGNSTELGIETYLGGIRGGNIPYNVKTDGPLDVVVKLPDGQLKTITYKAKLEEIAKIATENSYGLETKESIPQVKIYKGLYVPKTVKKKYAYRTDVLAIPKDARIVSVGGTPIEDILGA